jgi:two-component system chemotaxis sensor kinase CheA
MIEDESLWQEFAAESEEHLDAIERALTAGGTDRPTVDRLFRAFHSIKGMSDALGAKGMKALAHRAEDLLGLARNGRVLVTGTVADTLLAAVDVLRRQRTGLLDTQRDTAPPADLLERLGVLIAGGPAPAAPAGAHPAVQPAAAPPDRPTADDRLARLAARAASAVRGFSVPFSEVAARQAMALGEAARQAGLDRLADGFEALGRADASSLLPALGRLRRMLQVLEIEAGAPAGAATFGGPPGGEADFLAPRLAALALQVDGVLGGADPAPLAAAAAEAADVAAAFGLEPVEIALWQLADLAGRIGDPDAAALLAVQGPALAERLRGAAEAGSTALRGLTEPVLQEPLDARIPAEFGPVLGAEGRRRTLAALTLGRVLYRMRMATGLPAELEQAVAAALTSEAEPLTSRTLLDRSPPELDMLLAAPADPLSLMRALDAADPDRRAVLAFEPAAQTQSEAPRTAPVTLRVRQDTVDRIIALEAEVRAAALAVAEALDQGGAAEATRALDALQLRLPTAAARELGTALSRLRRVHETLERADRRLSLGMRRLDEAVMEMRVVPIGTLLARLPRLVRAVAQASGKQVDLVVEGEEVTIDRSLVELLADPLLHMVRNAVDHGIETPEQRLASGKPPRARLTISAARRTGQIRVQVVDDGRGIMRDRVLARATERGLVDPAQAARLSEEEVYALLFRPGFSTAERITETSGRGVGLDVVQDAVRGAGGTVEVASTPGSGSTFTLRLPLTAAVQPVVLVEAGGHPYALPAARVDAVLDGGVAAGCEVVDLSAILGIPADSRTATTVRRPIGATVLMKAGGRAFGLHVDKVQRRTDLLLRPIHPALAALPAVGGVGVLGNGEPVVVLEPDGLAPGQAT